MELRTVNFDDKYFECEGRKFYVKDSLSFARYKVLQELNLEFGYSANFHDLFKQVRIAWDHMNNLKLGEAAVVLHNIMYGIISLDEKDDSAFRMCALFVDEEGEDPAVYDEGKMRENIDCWEKGGLDSAPFFHFAAGLCTGWIPAYKTVLNDGLKPPKGQEKQNQSPGK